MHEIEFQIILIRSSIEFTTRLLWQLQGLSGHRDDVRDCLAQLKKYQRELKKKEHMLAAS